MALVKFEESSKEASRNPKFRQIFEIIGGGFDIRNIKLGEASKARPFLSPLAWAYYSAYQAIVIQYAMKFETLKIGVEFPEEYLNSEGVKKLVKAVLPHQSGYLDKYGSRAFYYLLDEIESLLLSELQNMQKGVESDKENAERAAAILKESDRLMESITKETSKA